MSHLRLDFGSQSEDFPVPNGAAVQLRLGRNVISKMEPMSSNCKLYMEVETTIAFCVRELASA